MYNGNYCDDKCEKLPEEILWLVGCTYKGHAENRQFVRNVISANMAVRKNIFNEIDFEYMPISKKRLFAPIKQLEDTLFCIRVNNRKVDTVLYDPDIVIYHNVPAERLKLSYIIKRSFSEGILKAQLGYAANKDNNNENTIRNNDGNKVLHYEQNYLYSLLTSIIKNFFLFKIRDNILLSITIISVVAGYVSEVVTHWAEWKEKKKFGKDEFKKRGMFMNTDGISVVVSTYDDPIGFVSQCLNSLLHQETISDIVVVDS